MCHCLECQRRTGAVISNQARFPREQVTIAGKATAWMRTAESGNALTFYFCPACGSTVYWENQGFPGYIAVAIGNFADPNFPAPNIAVWEESRHPWVSLPPETPPKHWQNRGEQRCRSGKHELKSRSAAVLCYLFRRRWEAWPGARPSPCSAARRRSCCERNIPAMNNDVTFCSATNTTIAKPKL
jgi:hypothetical protein